MHTRDYAGFTVELGTDFLPFKATHICTS